MVPGQRHAQVHPEPVAVCLNLQQMYPVADCWMNSLMLYPSLMIQLLARMMSTTKCFPNDALHTLLNIVNNIWASGRFPTSWCTSTVIAVPKSGKDTSDPSNYRPIALTSCICKVMERMITSHLVWYCHQASVSRGD